MRRILGIYIHIPFCRSKCDYCDFYSLAQREDRMDAYQKALLTQIRQTAKALKDYQVDTIYFGGGTPSYYGEKRLRELLAALRKGFNISKSPEVTLECNPDSVDPKSMLRLRRAGFNRVSLGMQTSDVGLLSALHRPHDFQQVLDAVHAIRAANIKNLSLDLIYGLPGQTLAAWQETLDQALALCPEHLSAYGLKLEEGTPLAQRAAQEPNIPDDDLQADMYLHLTQRLGKAGLRQYEISNFSKTGKESRHNLKYWMGRPYVGFGPGAHSYIDGYRYALAPDLEGYIQSLQNGEPLAMVTEQIGPQERAREYLLLHLRTMRGIEEWEYRREFYLNFEPLQHKLEFYESQGWASQSGHRWHFTPTGFLLSNQLISELLDCQEEAPDSLPSSLSSDPFLFRLQKGKLSKRRTAGDAQKGALSKDPDTR